MFDSLARALKFVSQAKEYSNGGHCGIRCIRTFELDADGKRWKLCESCLLNNLYKISQW